VTCRGTGRRGVEGGRETRARKVVAVKKEGGMMGKYESGMSLLSPTFLPTLPPLTHPPSHSPL